MKHRNDKKVIIPPRDMIRTHNNFTWKFYTARNRHFFIVLLSTIFLIGITVVLGLNFKIVFAEVILSLIGMFFILELKGGQSIADYIKDYYKWITKSDSYMYKKYYGIDLEKIVKKVDYDREE